MNAPGKVILTAVMMFASQLAVSATEPALSQTSQSQTANQDYFFENATPAYAPETGPSVKIHRSVSPFVKNGKFEPFVTVAASDGFRIDYLDDAIGESALSGVAMLVVANAYSVGGIRDYRNFGTLDAPSVYSEKEIADIKGWVADGGSLLVLADHSPFAGGTIQLAAAFGFTYITGSAIHRDTTLENVLTEISFQKQGEGRLVGRLASHPVTNGSMDREPVERFFAFGGQAIIPPAEADNLLTIPDGFESVMTNSFFKDFNSAPRIDSSSLSQGAVLEFGKGRVAIFGETGGFTSQLVDGTIRFGMGNPEAPQNEEFVLSVLRWLARYEPE